jgi:hypothetical protein
MERCCLMMALLRGRTIMAEQIEQAGLDVPPLRSWIIRHPIVTFLVLVYATTTALVFVRPRASDEREQLLTQLRRALRPGGHPHRLGATTAERARKAVTARIRDSIGRITEVLPDVDTHLDRTVRTGTTCRYDPGPP